MPDWLCIHGVLRHVISTFAVGDIDPLAIYEIIYPRFVSTVLSPALVMSSADYVQTSSDAGA